MLCFLFPNGCTSSKIRVTNSFSQIHEYELFLVIGATVKCRIMYVANGSENNSNCFSFTINTPNSYEKKRDKKSSGNSVYEEINQYQKLFIICYIKNEHVAVHTSPHVRSEFWLVKRVFCFVSKFPFFKFFLDFLTFFLSKVEFLF